MHLSAELPEGGVYKSEISDGFLIDKITKPTTITIEGNCKTIHILNSKNITIDITGKVVGGIVLLYSSNVKIAAKKIFNLHLELSNDILIKGEMDPSLMAVYNCWNVKTNDNKLFPVCCFRRLVYEFNPRPKIIASA